MRKYDRRGIVELENIDKKKTGRDADPSGQFNAETKACGMFRRFRHSGQLQDEKARIGLWGLKKVRANCG